MVKTRYFFVNENLVSCFSFNLFVKNILTNLGYMVDNTVILSCDKEDEINDMLNSFNHTSMIERNPNLLDYLNDVEDKLVNMTLGVSASAYVSIIRDGLKLIVLIRDGE